MASLADIRELKPFRMINLESLAKYSDVCIAILLWETLTCSLLQDYRAKVDNALKSSDGIKGLNGDKLCRNLIKCFPREIGRCMKGITDDLTELAEDGKSA